MFEPVDDRELTRIGVFGVGGAGCNAVNHMIQSGLTGVDFYAVNTDLQSLHMNLAENKVQIGAQLTGGTGSGGKPETGRKACEESQQYLREIVAGYDLVFIATGEGGGTGTGASPLVASTAREQGCLVVAVATKPFEFEGRVRALKAIEGIEALRPCVDTLITVPNQKLLAMYSNEPLNSAFRLADEVLCNAARGIADIVTIPQMVNIDFSDVRDVLQEPGGALMGLGTANGTDRAREAASRAICSPLVDELAIDTARRVLLNITGDEQMTLQEIEAVAMAVQEATRHQADIRFGASHDKLLEGRMKVTVIATGIEDSLVGVGGLKDIVMFNNDLARRRRPSLDDSHSPVDDIADRNDLRIPAVLRRHVD